MKTFMQTLMRTGILSIVTYCLVRSDPVRYNVNSYLGTDFNIKVAFILFTSLDSVWMFMIYVIVALTGRVCDSVQ